MSVIEFRSVEKLEYGRYEAMNSLMTNIQYSGENIKSIVVTSSAPDEGKSTTAFDLARTFAENGYDTVLLDMDFRKSVFMSKNEVDLKGNRISGLAQLLAGRVNPGDVICDTNIKNLHVGFAGATSANPVGLLKSSNFDKLLKVLTDITDMVIIDAPPVGAVIDAAIIAPKTDGAVLVVAYGQTTGKQALAAKKQLEQSGCNVLGVVMNKTPMNKKNGYYKYYGKNK